MMIRSIEQPEEWRISYKKSIRSWHKLATSYWNYFIKFMLEYLAFICFINTHLYVGQEDDRPKIQRLKRNRAIENFYLNLVYRDNKLGEAWENIIEELNRDRLGNVSRDARTTQEIKWWNFSGDDLKQKSNEEKNRLTGMIYSLKDWENMVEFWYSIRNNLFHGLKNPEIRRDRILVSNGFKTLRPLVKLFLDNIDDIENLS